MVVSHKKLLSSASPVAAFLWQRRPRSERLIATTRSNRGLEVSPPVLFPPVKITLTATEAALTPIKGTSGPAAYPDMAMIRLFLAGDVMTGRGIEQILHRLANLRYSRTASSPRWGLS